VDGLKEGLAEISECGSGSGFDFTQDDGGEEAAQSGAEIAGGEITSGEERGNILAGLLGDEGLRLLARMEKAEVRMAGA
jgi:hypothetical protein